LEVAPDLLPAPAKMRPADEPTQPAGAGDAPAAAAAPPAPGQPLPRLEAGARLHRHPPAAHPLGHHRPARRRPGPRPQPQSAAEPDQEARYFARSRLIPRAWSRHVATPAAGRGPPPLPGLSPIVCCNPLRARYYGQRTAPTLSTGTLF